MTQNTAIVPESTTAELAGERIAEMSASVRESCGQADSAQFDLYQLAYDAIRHASPEVIGALAVELLVHKGRQAAGSHVKAPAWIQDAPSGKFPRAVPVDNKGTSTYVDFWHATPTQVALAIGSRRMMEEGLGYRILALQEQLAALVELESPATPEVIEA